MCLVIDPGCLVKVFDPRHREHNQFAPVWEWIYDGNGRMILGGTKYDAELRRVPKVFPMMTELEKRHHLVRIPTSKVDAIAKALKAKVTCSAFDDEHIVALVIVSGCRVICADDEAAMQYFTRTELYSTYKVRRPRVYRRKKDHVGLCCDGNIVPVCR